MNNPLLVILAYALALFAILYFVVIVPGNKKNKQVKEMHASVKAGDKVTTIGGLIGKVVERDGDTVRLLVDEANGTTATFVIYAIQQIIKPAEE
ncbi:MAG: preprotein translocase subunit YajC [Lachnospiraceae bacterium]|nr:preprotein translocase subunit YajC [Lachnospiraceae bacterium]